jgi:hypothetical protein
MLTWSEHASAAKVAKCPLSGPAALSRAEMTMPPVFLTFSRKKLTARLMLDLRCNMGKTAGPESGHFATFMATHRGVSPFFPDVRYRSRVVLLPGWPYTNGAGRQNQNQF